MVAAAKVWSLGPNEDVYRLVRYLNDRDLDRVEKHPIFRMTKGRCPNCDNTGVFRYEGTEWICPDDDYGHRATRLFKQYLLADIPLQYQREDARWLQEHEVWPDVLDYLNDWDLSLANGVGWDIYGGKTGIGKTTLATYLLKEVVKRGMAGSFALFIDLTQMHDLDQKERNVRLERLTSAALVVIDDVLAPTSARQADFYEEKFERIVRDRAANNLPTIVTTNMEEEEFAKVYPRVYSVLSQKQRRVSLSGSDARLGEAYDRTFDRVGAKEVAPIT